MLERLVSESPWLQSAMHSDKVARIFGQLVFSMRRNHLIDRPGTGPKRTMISGMHVQKTDIIDILARARRLGRRTMVGGPSSEPEALLILDDHVVVGEPDEVFDRIAIDLETGLARRLYLIHKKPDVSKTPAPRFDLLKLENYVLMSVQFSRGCPFQCEFRDIITLYGRKPRTKRPNQLVAELQASVDLGWRKPVFVVDDNFIGNHKLALALVQEMEAWQKARDYPLLFFTEASIDLAQKPELIEAMVKANFFVVFIGIESPSKESLKEAKKFQNLRQDSLQSIRFIQSKGLWVCGSFILGFDSDTEDIFEQQKDFAGPSTHRSCHWDLRSCFPDTTSLAMQETPWRNSNLRLLYKVLLPQVEFTCCDIE